MSAQKKMMEAAFAAGTSAGGAPDTDGLAKVILKVENAIKPDGFKKVDTEVLVPPKSSVFFMLLQAYKDGKIAFDASWDGQWGSHLIYSINGLDSIKNTTYWSFEDGKGNLFPRGVDKIFVDDGDVIMFRYVKF